MMDIDSLKKIYNEFKFFIFKILSFFNLGLIVLFIFVLGIYLANTFPILGMHTGNSFLSSEFINLILSFILYALFIFLILLLFIYFINNKRRLYYKKSVFIPFTNVLLFKVNGGQSGALNKEYKFLNILNMNKFMVEGSIVNSFDSFKNVIDVNKLSLIEGDSLLLPIQDAVGFYIKKYNIVNIYWLDFDFLGSLKFKSYFYDPFITNINLAFEDLKILEDDKLTDYINLGLTALMIWKTSFDDLSNKEIDKIINLLIGYLSRLNKTEYIYFYYIYLFLLIHYFEKFSLSFSGEKYFIFIESGIKKFKIFSDKILNNLGNKRWDNIFHLLGYSLFFYASYDDKNKSNYEYLDIFLNFFSNGIKKLISGSINIDIIGRYWVNYLIHPEIYGNLIKEKLMFLKDNVSIIDFLNLSNKGHVVFLIALINNNIIKKTENIKKILNSILYLKSPKGNIDKLYKQFSDHQWELIIKHLEGL